MGNSVNNNSIQKCERCGSYDLVKGNITGTSLVGFLPKGAMTSFSAKVISATACKNCGCVCNFEVDPNKLQKYKS